MALSVREPKVPASAEPTVPVVAPNATALTVLVSPESTSVSLLSTQYGEAVFRNWNLPNPENEGER